ncbi:hypothetical protein PoB_004645000 [Plakobranchus ocellatus]|uniref:Uncharacterized protein n=1 Tax=Plakobranchus ocellatus TaxID=259542 RepID=A0AAV4BHC5_9GAST|nr:hypothetical protein PoB_004645000 [Plakobranchus ocellatus]
MRGKLIDFKVFKLNRVTGKIFIRRKYMTSKKGRIFVKAVTDLRDIKNVLSDMASPQQDDLRLSGPPSGQDTGGGARTPDRRDSAYLRADLLSTAPPTPPPSLRKGQWNSQ